MFLNNRRCVIPRDNSGVYSRPIPPGASGYQFNTDIKETEVNGEIEDIGLALTNSITKNGVTIPTADLPMGGFVHSGLGQANANGETVRFQALAKATGLTVTASGLQALPFEGSYSVVTGTGFNVTGFNDTYDGRTVTLEYPAGLTLVNSSGFLLMGGQNRVTAAGDVQVVSQKSTGVYKELSYTTPAIVTMTGYSGADIALSIGQVAIYDVTAATSVPLRLATGNNQGYEITLSPTYQAGATSGSNATLLPNNTTFAASFNAHAISATGATVAAAFSNSNGSFVLDAGNTMWSVSAKASTSTLSKTLASTYSGSSAASFQAGTYHNVWKDTTTAWTSLGTVSCNAITGRITVRRLA